MSTMTLDQAHQLAAQLAREGRLPEAGQICAQIVAAFPSHVPTLSLQASLAHRQGRAEESAELLKRVVAAEPSVAGHHSNLGMVLADCGRLDEALAASERAVAIDPGMAEAFNNIGNILSTQGRWVDSLSAYREAVALRPNFPQALNNLSGVLISLGELDEAIETCRAALAINPDIIPATMNLGRALRESGRVEEAVEHFRAADARQPDSRFLSAMLFTIHFHPDYDRRRILEEHLRWNARYAVPLRSQRLPHANDPTPDRRLRVGYLAYDLGNNPLGRFLLPLIEHHDRAAFEVYCYADVRRPDRIGDRLAARADVMRPTRHMPHDWVARQVREDGIDVLIDLSMHSHGSRLTVFACKPAPVQITYLAYCSTTGVESMDYRISDPYLDPPGADESLYTEKTLRLPHTYWCYPQPAEAPQPEPPPRLTTGRVTFGCLNDFAKINPGVLATWCEVMRRVPTSRLILHSKNGSHRRGVLDVFKTGGVDAGRIGFVGYLTTGAYYETYQHIDVALDPFPWAGGTTTCDALWMGVPVVSLVGETGVSRGGLSILSNVGLAEFAVNTTEAYVGAAVRLASDPRRLTALRTILRTRMLESPLMNGPQFAGDVEAIYRRAWTEWCAGRTTADPPAPPTPAP